MKAQKKYTHHKLAVIHDDRRNFGDGCEGRD